MIVGIDLGTTNSVAGIFIDGGVQVIPNALGDHATPSAVALGDDGGLLVGLPARERARTHPASAVQAFKRWMGSTRTVTLGTRTFRPEELSALVLQSLKADAQAFVGEPVTEAVITVPAYFNDAQRRATRMAGELAGLKVQALLNEPTAAGLAYGLQERPDHTTFLVFDLGGGTFDVSVLEYFEGVVQVRASAGDTRLGGEDFAAVLGELFFSRTGTAAPLRAELSRSGGWWRAIEQAKRDLTDRDSATLSLMHDGRCHECTIARADFESASAELLQRLRRPIERALGDARLAAHALDEVVLVGGATRMPMVRQMVARLFQRLPLRTIDADLAIAHGAAIQGALRRRDAALQEVVLTDVMPYSLGIIVADHSTGHVVADRFSPIIERNTPVPVSRVQTYYTMQDRQPAVVLDIRQGESPIGSENLHLGELKVPVPPLPAGQACVQVRFSYDSNGLLEVDARESRSGTAVSTVIRNTTTQMTDAQVQEALARLRELKRHPREEEENRYLLERAKRLYEDRTGAQRQSIQAWMSQFEAALDSQEPQRVRAARKVFRDALDSIDGGFRY